MTDISTTTAPPRAGEMAFAVISLNRGDQVWELTSEHPTRAKAIPAILAQWARPRLARIIPNPKTKGAL